MAWAWTSLRLYFAISFSLASLGDLLPRISLMTASTWSTATMRPSRMCSRRRAVSSSHFVLRVTTFFWWLIK